MLKMEIIVMLRRPTMGVSAVAVDTFLRSSLQLLGPPEKEGEFLGQNSVSRFTRGGGLR